MGGRTNAEAAVEEFQIFDFRWQIETGSLQGSVASSI
jgi:hypothetical protein